MARRPDTPCAGCGKLLWSGQTSLPAGERRCRQCRAERRAATLPVPLMTCQKCQRAFPRTRKYWKYCSDPCRGPANLSNECATPGCERIRLSRDRICGNCLRAREDPERAKARQRRKTHRRKIRTRRADLPLDEEIRLRSAAKKCPLCRVRLLDAPYLPASKELDHIVPLNRGGTHTIWNVRIICRTCNVRRPKDGSDVAQVPLFAVGVA